MPKNLKILILLYGKKIDYLTVVANELKFSIFARFLACFYYNYNTHGNARTKGRRRFFLVQNVYIFQN